MRFWLAIAATAIQAASAPGPAATLFGHGRTFDEFVATVVAERDLWVKNAAHASVSRDLTERLERVGNRLQVLAVAEDWCPDSANTIPYLAKLASQADVALRIVDRRDGRELMKRHPAPDGRAVTPTVILLRDGVDVAAWVERPAALQRLFESMTTDPESARRFASRQAWYDADAGRSATAEFVALAEHIAAGRHF